MATIVERPLSAFSDSMPSSTVVPQRRRRESVEIIDVDSFEELPNPNPNPNPRPAQRRRVEQDPVVIELLDSDEEPEPVAGSSGGSGEGSQRGFRLSTAPDVRANTSRALAGPSGPRARRLRELFSPPPPIPDDSIPPVPALPRRYSAFGSFPETRPRPARVPVPPSSNLNASEASGSSSSSSSNPAPVPVPGPILASSRPFAFEIDSSPPPEPIPGPAAPRAGPSRVPPRVAEVHEEFDFRPAPRARHNPPMGLGGALISYNNARVEAERLDRQRRGERRAAGGRVAPAVALAGGGSGSGSGANRRPNAAPGNSILRRLASLNPWRWGDDALVGQHHDVDLLALAPPQDGGDDRTRGDAQLALDMYLQDHEDRFNARFAHPARAFARRELALLRGWGGGAGGAGEEEESYKKEWTHPTSAEAGFVFDFAPSEIVPAFEGGNGKGKGKEVVIDVDAENSKEGVSTLLVCALCLDPLLVRSDGIVDGGEEEARRRRVWGLRCGHLIDGKCFEELRKPKEEEGAEKEMEEDAGDELELEPKGKGKGKGKGKAKAREEEQEEQHEHEHDELFDEDMDTAGASSGIRSRLRSRQEPDGLFDEDTAIDATSSGGIRSRLRPRASGSTTMPGAFEIAAPLPPVAAPARRRAPAKRKGKGKGKGRAPPKKPVVEARHEWTCPVAGCGRLHESEKIEGVWVNAPDKGAIGVFV